MRSCLNSAARLVGASDCLDLDWTALTFADLQVVRARLGEHYPPATANTMMAAVRGVMRAAWQLGLIDSDLYMQLNELKRFRGRRLRPGRMLSFEEQAALFRACAADPNQPGRRDAAALALMLGAGLRRAEALTLACEAVNLDEASLRVIGKGDKERLIPLGPTVVQPLREWLDVRGDAPGPLLVRCRKMDSFVQPDLHPLAPRGKSLNSILERRCRQAGVERCTPHDLRRTYISMLLDAGVDLVTVQQLAGHTDPATTALYDRRSKERLHKAARLIRLPLAGCG